MKIREVIVVEGKHDLQKIKACVDADVIYTSGTHLSKETLDQIKHFNETRGVIVFTDPDGPGEKIRRRIIEVVGTCKHASLATKQSKHKEKVGIEHARCEDIVESLMQSATYDIEGKSLSWYDFVSLGLTGQKDSQNRRNYLSTYYNMPVTNGKRCFQYLNMMGKSVDELRDVIEEAFNGDNRE